MENGTVGSKAFGISNLLNVVLFMVSILIVLEDIFEDGKVKFAEGFKLFSLFPQIGGVLKSLKDAYKEALDLDAEETLELNRLVAKELDLQNDKTEELIQSVFSVLLSLFNAFALIRVLVKKK
jgi:hypothetical protein